MTGTFSSKTVKQLTLHFILQNIDYRKRCLYLQEIISLCKKEVVWKQALFQFFDLPFKSIPLNKFSQN